MIASLLACGLLALASAADPPDPLLLGKEILRIDMIPGRMGGITFKHADHARTRLRADGEPITCRDCHHDLETDRPTSAASVRRCVTCHAALDEPPRTVGGKLARPLVLRKPDRALDYRTVLIHEYCRACHQRNSKPEKRLHTCKRCHERGIGPDVIHGDATQPAAAPGTRR